MDIILNDKRNCKRIIQEMQILSESFFYMGQVALPYRDKLVMIPSIYCVFPFVSLTFLSFSRRLHILYVLLQRNPAPSQAIPISINGKRPGCCPAGPILYILYYTKLTIQKSRITSWPGSMHSADRRSFPSLPDRHYTGSPSSHLRKMFRC